LKCGVYLPIPENFTHQDRRLCPAMELTSIPARAATRLMISPIESGCKPRPKTLPFLGMGRRRASALIPPEVSQCWIARTGQVDRLSTYRDSRLPSRPLLVGLRPRQIDDWPILIYGEILNPHMGQFERLKGPKTPINTRTSVSIMGGLGHLAIILRCPPSKAGFHPFVMFRRFGISPSYFRSRQGDAPSLGVREP
jgi:hypothetical protein